MAGSRGHPRWSAGRADGLADDSPVVDPDVDLHDPAQLAEVKPREWDIIVAVGIGGVLGAQARYGLSLALPHRSSEFPWATLLINITGCFLIGLLMVVVLAAQVPPRLVRPFFGVGILGGYTTYSTFATDTIALTVAHQVALAASYLIATVLGCAAAVTASTSLATWVGRRRQERIGAEGR